MKNILWLASWYPNQLTPYDGDFIQRHARAVALFQKITVIHVKKDEEGIVTNDLKEIISSSNNLTEIIVFYHSIKTGIGLINKFFSALKYKRTYKSALTKYIKENGTPGIVHVHVALNAGRQALWLKEKFSVPFILSEHWSGYFEESDFKAAHLNVFRQKLLKKIFDEAEKLIVVSDVLGKAISKTFRNKKYDVIYNTVDTNIFFPVEKVKSAVPMFIHISSLNYEKNPVKIIEAFFLLKNKGHEFNLVIFGPEKQDVLNEVSAKDLTKNVTFKKEVPQAELAKTLQQADALILFSHYETFGCVVIEANACGVPAILSDLPVFKEYTTENVNSIFATANDAADLAQKLEDFILNKYYFNKHQIAKNAAAKFSYEVIGKQFVELYAGIAK